MSTPEKTKQAVETTEIKTVKDFLEQKKDLIARTLPKTITPDRLIGIFDMLLKSSPELSGCTEKSLIGAVIQTVQLGLTPGNIGHCYYVPFNNKQKDNTYRKEIQFILGYRGMVELVNRAGKAVILSTEVVYENDSFKYELGLSPVLKHSPTEGERGSVRGVYCVAKNIVAFEKVFVYLTKEDIDKVRKASKAGNSEYSPWNNWYEEMAKKTAIKRICKLLPLAVELQKGISSDETTKDAGDEDMYTSKDKTNWRENAEEAQVSDEQPPTEEPPPSEEPPTEEEAQASDDSLAQ